MTSTLDPHVQSSLTQHGLTYRVFDCDPELADTAAFCKHYGFSPDQSANTIIVAGKADPICYAACVVLATTKLDVNKSVTRLLETRKASFASGDQTTALTGMMIGGVTAFGLPASLPIYIDAAVLARPEVILGGGNRSTKVILSPAELRKLPGVTIVDSLATPRE